MTVSESSGMAFDTPSLADSLRMMIEAAPNPMVMIGADGVIVLINSQAERAFGYTRQELLGRPVEILVPEEFRPNHPHHRKGFFATPQPRPMGLGRDLHGRRKDGSTFPVEIGLTPIEADGVRYVLSSIIDLTLWKKQEERFRLVVEAAPNAMVMVNNRGLIEMVNTQAENVFGYPREEMIGQPIEILVPQRFHAHHPDYRNAYFSNSTPRFMGVGRDLYGRRKDGSEFPVEIGLNPIETDEGVMVLSAIVDISDRKQKEKRLRLVVEAAPNAMVMVNNRGLIEMVNTQAENVFGYPREEMIGQPIEMLVPQRLREHHPAYRNAYFNDTTPRPMGAGRDLYGRRKDGSEFPVEIGLNPIETEEGMMVLSAIVDISDRKQKEERIAASLKEKELMLGEIHHRVKNNLQFIRSLIDLQASKIEDEGVRAMLTDCKNRINSMALVHNLLYQSKDFSLIDFQQFIQQVIHTLKASFVLSDRRVDLLVDAERLSLPIDVAIPCGLIVNELIANSFKHAFPEGRGGRITVQAGLAEKTNAEGKNVVISVSDDGIGIPEDKDVTSGDTLGLTLVYLLTDQIGGALAVNRANPTRFELRFSI
ncbi:PAS domain S-box protein [Ferrovibrio sp.]|uniref:PAS domain S-box protein n=1 Tax=Ferrovibrio sp. TaxID=1917215 RepID=UPI0035AE7D78